jgi:hypothetical protein
LVVSKFHNEFLQLKKNLYFYKQNTQIMPLFQNTVVGKHLNTQDAKMIQDKWELFKAHFHNTQIQENIRNSNEEQYQEG